MRFVQSCTAAAGCLTLEPLSPVVGAEVQHFDLVAALDADDPAALAARLRAALEPLRRCRLGWLQLPQHHARTMMMMTTTMMIAAAVRRKKMKRRPRHPG